MRLAAEEVPHVRSGRRGRSGEQAGSGTSAQRHRIHGSVSHHGFYLSRLFHSGTPFKVGWPLRFGCLKPRGAVGSRQVCECGCGVRQIQPERGLASSAETLNQPHLDLAVGVAHGLNDHVSGGLDERLFAAYTQAHGDQRRGIVFPRHVRNAGLPPLVFVGIERVLKTAEPARRTSKARRFSGTS